MNQQRKELRSRIRLYFGEVTNHVRVFIYQKMICVDVEYEDFYPENRVEKEIRAIIGNDCLLNVKREYSDKMRSDIVAEMIHQIHEEAISGIFASRFLTFDERIEKYEIAM